VAVAETMSVSLSHLCSNTDYCSLLPYQKYEVEAEAENEAVLQNFLVLTGSLLINSFAPVQT
jgi:hypothetical protein